MSPSQDIYCWDRHDCVSARSGPTVEEMTGSEEDLLNQCVAVEVARLVSPR